MKYFVAIMLFTGILKAENSDQLLKELGDKSYKVRKAARAKIINAYDKNPDILTHLYKLAYGEQTKDPEIIVSSKELVKKIVKNKVFTERGFLGVTISNDLSLTTVYENSPAEKSGAEQGWIIKEIGGVTCTDKGVDFTIKQIHKKRAGEKLTVVYVKPDKKETSLTVTLARRSEFIQGEDVKAQKEEFYVQWLDKMSKMKE